MPVEQTIQDEGYTYFLAEAPELLQQIEQGLFELEEDFHIQKVHNLMRAAHNLKGAAASVGLETIKKVAHYLEDVFKALYNPEVSLDSELLALLFEGYECLREPLMAEVTGNKINDGEILDRAANVFASCQEKLGDFMGEDAKMPTAAELGFDITLSIFETGVTQRLEELRDVLKNGDGKQIADVLRSHAEVFVGLAESLNLSGFLAVSNHVLTALNNRPKEAVKIAKVAFADWKKGRQAVLKGDRSVGGEPSVNLKKLATDFVTDLTDGADGVKQGKNGVKKEQKNGTIKSQEKQVSVNNGSQKSEVIKQPETSEDKTAPEEAELPNLDDIFGDADFDESLADFVEIDQISDEDEEEIIEENGNGKGAVKETAPSKIEQKKTAVKSQDKSSSILAKKSDNSQKETPTKYATPVMRQSVRVDLEHLDSLNHLVGELLINQNRLATRNEQLQAAVKELTSQLKKQEKNEEKSSTTPEETNQNSTRKKLKELSPTEASNIIFNLVAESSETAVKQQRLLLNLQEDLMEVRMSPLGELFQRFPRILQQTANSQSKPIELTINGNEVLSDKSVWDKIYDPLLHLLRNSIAHGIESKEVRRQRGKPEKGQIFINAFYQGTRLVIEVSDDGKGIDLEEVRQKAIDLDIISPQQAKMMPESGVWDLLFESGFSTAAKVDDLAGRGVGLDIVKAQLESIKGSVSVRSQYLLGTTFSLQIPIQMTIAKLMVVQGGKAVYAIPSESIAQIIIPNSTQIKQSGGQRVLYWGDRLVPLHKLSDLMLYKTYNKNLKNSWTDLTSFPLGNKEVSLSNNPSISLPSHPLLLLSEAGIVAAKNDGDDGQEKIYALEVDELFGEQELTIKPLGSSIAYPSYIYGCSILGDGSLMLVIDAVSLINQAVEQLTVFTGSKQQSLPPATNIKLPGDAANTNQSRLLPGDAEKWRGESIEVQTSQLPLGSASCILVVDDSATLRKTIVSTLTRAGYQVIQAGNGVEALQKLRQHPQIDLIISDVEMPEMDGFQFLDRRRQEPSLAQIPVVMLTACRSDKHQQLALALGATAYLTKPCSQPDLLATVSEKKLSN
jgi:chemotaxis protein histidine kinase CheA/CheY-like chemotaxis protein